MLITQTQETYTTRTQKIWIEDKILHCEHLDVSNHELEDAIINIEAGIRLTNGKKIKKLVDIRKMKAISREARLYYASGKNTDCTEACALLADNGISKIIANFYILLNEPQYQTKVFDNYQEAVNWLKSI